MDPATWGPLANQGGVVGMALVFITGLTRGWWITAREAADQRAAARDRLEDALERLDEMRADRDYWREAADRAGGLAETAVQTPAARRRRTTNAPG